MTALFLSRFVFAHDQFYFCICPPQIKYKEDLQILKGLGCFLYDTPDMVRSRHLRKLWVSAISTTCSCLGTAPRLPITSIQQLGRELPAWLSATLEETYTPHPLGQAMSCLRWSILPVKDDALNYLTVVFAFVWEDTPEHRKDLLHLLIAAFSKTTWCVLP